MPRPKINLEDIGFPSIDTPMAGFAEQACGESYHVGFKLTQPYLGEGEWSLDLPARSDLITSGTGDSLTPAERAGLAGLASDAAKTIVAAKNLLDGKNPKLPVRLLATGGGQLAGGEDAVKVVVDPKNLQAIQHLIDQALYYGGLATNLWKYWANEWRPTVVKEIEEEGAGGRGMGMAYIQTQMPNWPLDKTMQEAIPLCASASKGAEIKWTTEMFAAIVQCPNELAMKMHSGDVQIFLDLIRSSMMWARCA